VWPSP